MTQMAPLEDQIRQLRIDLDRSRNVINNFGHLQTQLHELSVTQQAVNQRLDLLSDLPEQLAAVRSELEELRNPEDSSPRPSTPRQKTNHTALYVRVIADFRNKLTLFQGLRASINVPRWSSTSSDI